jgi:nicotinate-nucleotide pyrophosphorylase (carboxylating)
MVPQASFEWDSQELTSLIRAALDEDIGRGDITAAALIPAGAAATAHIIARQEMVLAGLPLAERVFRALDSRVEWNPAFEDGALIQSGAAIATLAGRARAILSAERTALNFFARLCGVATLTRRFVQAIAGTRAQIRDTRKTTPLLRALEKYAVRTGGGTNHRMGLFDAFLIKENHIALAGGVAQAVRRARSRSSAEATACESFAAPPDAPVEVEVRNEAELREALAARADAVLLDNLSPVEAARLIEIVRSTRRDCVVEISGGVNLANVRAYAEAGADFISIGALTHSAPAADLSLLVEPPGVR